MPRTPVFSFTDNELINPIGMNQLESFALYYQRTLYEQWIYPIGTKFPIDIWYDKQLYGRVDRDQMTVVPVTSNLVPIRSAVQDNMFILGVVADHFEAFVTHMEKAHLMGAVLSKGNPKMYNIKAYRGYTDPVRKYNAYLEGAYKVYNKTFSARQNEKVTGFTSFVDDYTQYLLNVATTYPVTKTNFLLTANVSPFASGLVIAIDNGDCGDDSYKYINYISDPNFDFYVRVAKKFGFIVDKNAPWILRADLFTEAFMDNFKFYYLDDSRTMVTKDNFFRAFYDYSYLTDIDQLRTTIVTGYRTLLQTKPYAEIFLSHHVGPGVSEFSAGCQRHKVKQLRKSVTEAEGRFLLTDRLMLDIYIALRHKEANTNSVNIQTVKNIAYEEYRTRADLSLTKLQNAVKYINSVYAKYVYTLGDIATSFPQAVTRATKRKRAQQRGE